MPKPGRAATGADDDSGRPSAGKCGGYDLETACGINGEIVGSMTTGFRRASRAHRYPNTLGDGEQCGALMRDWHPELVLDD